MVKFVDCFFLPLLIKILFVSIARIIRGSRTAGGLVIIIIFKTVVRGLTGAIRVIGIIIRAVDCKNKYFWVRLPIILIEGTLAGGIRG